MRFTAASTSSGATRFWMRINGSTIRQEHPSTNFGGMISAAPSAGLSKKRRPFSSLIMKALDREGPADLQVSTAYPLFVKEEMALVLLGRRLWGTSAKSAPFRTTARTLETMRIGTRLLAALPLGSAWIITRVFLDPGSSGTRIPAPSIPARRTGTGQARSDPL